MSRGAMLVVRFLAPAAAALALFAILTGDAAIRFELRVMAPAAAPAGSRVPIRAQLYTDLHRAQGPRLAIAPISAWLRTPSGELVSPRRQLSVGYAATLQGELPVPHDAQGVLTLVVAFEDNSIRVEQPLQVIERTAQRPPIAPAPRPLRALQQLTLGPVRALRAGGSAPAELALRVAGGACVPELQCELLVHVGEPAAALRIVPNASVSVAPAASTEGPAPQAADVAMPGATPATSGVALLRVITHGPEASFELRAERDDVPVAAREVRLPVALGADAMALDAATLDAPLPPAPASIRPRLLGDDAAGIFDLFREGRWTRTASVSSKAHVHARAPSALEPLPAGGLWRVQMRRDPFASQSAAVRTLYVREPSEDYESALRALAKRVLLAHPDDALARSLARSTASTDADPLAARYLLAALDEGIYELPESRSSFPASIEQRARRRSKVRDLALLVLTLAALSLAVLMTQRGLVGSAQADRILRDSGELPAERSRARRLRTLRVAGSVLSVLLAFAAIALYLVVRGNAS